MPKTIALTTHIPATPGRIWQEVQRPQLLDYVARGLVRFHPVKGRPFPEIWSEGQYKAWLLLFGFLPIGWQIIGIEFPPAAGPRKQLRDNGCGWMIKTWDHMITVEPDGEGTRYTDSVVIDAGLFTLPVTLFARIFYAHRQRRWLRLVKSGFDYTG